MPFDGEYDFLEPVPALDAGQDYCFSGKSKKTGDKVSIHLLAASREYENYTLLAKIFKLIPAARIIVLKVGVESGLQYVISHPLADQQPLRQWLANSPLEEPKTPGNAPPPAVNQPDQMAPNASTPPGEFTSLFSGAPASGMASGGTIADHGSKQNSPAIVGEFTALFMLDKPGQTEASIKDPPRVSQSFPTPELQKASLGEFTMLLRGSDAGASAPSIRQPERPAAVPPQTKPPGEFTTLFPGINTNPKKSKIDPAIVAEPPKQPRIPPPVPAPSTLKAAPPGEFTAMFERPVDPPPVLPLATTPSPPVDNEATRLFAGTPALAPKVDMREPDWTPPRTSQGDFTKMMESPMASSTTFGNGLDFKPSQKTSMTPPPASKREGEFTRMFGREELAPISPRPHSYAAPANSPEATGVFTNSDSARIQPAPGWSEEEFQQTFGSPPPPTPIRVVVTKKESAKLHLVIFLGVIFLLAVIVVLFFVLRR